MNDLGTFTLSLMTGVLIGTFFFGGLWWTVEKGTTSAYAGLWFFASTLLRTGFAVIGFYSISNGDWRRLFLCLLGFFIARVVAIRLTRLISEGTHAP